MSQKIAVQNFIAVGADVDNAYLYGESDRPMIMEQPTDSSRIPKHPEKVCLVVKSLYEALQAGEIWGTFIQDQSII